MNSVNMLNFKCLRNIPMFGGKYGHGAQQAGLSHPHGCESYLLHSEAMIVEEVTQRGEKETRVNCL